MIFLVFGAAGLHATIENIPGFSPETPYPFGQTTETNTSQLAVPHNISAIEAEAHYPFAQNDMLHFGIRPANINISTVQYYHPTLNNYIISAVTTPPPPRHWTDRCLDCLARFCESC